MDTTLLCRQTHGLPQFAEVSILRKARALLLWLALASACYGQDEPAKFDLIFVGDINLGRLVQTEMSLRDNSPWNDVLSSMPSATVQVGNLEGVVASDSESCLKPSDYCFSFPADRLKYFSEAGFTHLSLANNHALDQGETGLENTRRALRTADLVGAALPESPYFVSSNGVRYGLVFINRIANAKEGEDDIPSPRVAQALELATSGADWVIVYIHWGQELTPWVSQTQRDEAQWLVEHGADMVVGSHPHVIQPVDCVVGHPVWFSLGNHIFDQKYPSTHTGALIACNGTSSLTCNGFRSTRGNGSAALQEIVAAPTLNTPSGCAPAKKTPTQLQVGGFAISISDTNETGTSTTVDLQAKGKDRLYELHNLPLRRVATYRLADGSQILLLLLELYSDLDRTVGLRPHVYRVGKNGIQPLWRGSGLAFPLIDVIPVHHGGGDVLCALHSGGSFLTGVQKSLPSFVMVYQWNGFGFTAVHDKTVEQKCQLVFESSLQRNDHSTQH